MVMNILMQANLLYDSLKFDSELVVIFFFAIYLYRQIIMKATRLKLPYHER
jgi:hypothetical protein